MSGNGDPGKRMTQEALQHEIGVGIVRLRKRNGWSQTVLARRLNVTRHRLGKWERGLNAPALEYLVVLLEVLQVTFEELALSRAASAPPLPPKLRKELTKALKALLLRLEPQVGQTNGRGDGKGAQVGHRTAFGAMEAPILERRSL